LDDSLTEGAIRTACNVMYDLLGRVQEERQGPKVRATWEQTGYVGGTPVLAIGVAEAALLAWDLTSEIQGVWRVPLTIVSTRDEVRYTYTCIMVLYGSHHAAAIGRCGLKELSVVPLKEQRPSQVVRHLVTCLAAVGHEVHTLYLGLPTEAGLPQTDNGAAAAVMAPPLLWRYLKLSCARQEWTSILGCCDRFVSERRTFRRAATLAAKTVKGRLPSVSLPVGFAPLSRRRQRIKAVPPLLVRRRRSPARMDPPCMGEAYWAYAAGCAKASAIRITSAGVWQATETDRLLALQGPLPLPPEEVRGCEPTDCSSVSSASLEEYMEDQALDYPTGGVFQGDIADNLVTAAMIAAVAEAAVSDAATTGLLSDQPLPKPMAALGEEEP